MYLLIYSLQSSCIIFDFQHILSGLIKNLQKNTNFSRIIINIIMIIIAELTDAIALISVV